jgi:hypothetical protein
MKQVDLRSDTVTHPTPGMREAMARAPLGDDVFGDDPSVNALQERIAGMLGFEAALFVPTGTQSNLCAILAHCQRGDEYIVGQMQHCYRWEGGGAAVFGSVQPQPLEHQEDGTLALSAIESAIKPDDPHFARSRLLALENTLGGKLLPMAYLDQATALARGKGLATHLDGARLFNAAVAQAALQGGDACARWRAGRCGSRACWRRQPRTRWSTRSTAWPTITRWLNVSPQGWRASTGWPWSRRRPTSCSWTSRAPRASGPARCWSTSRPTACLPPASTGCGS